MRDGQLSPWTYRTYDAATPAAEFGSLSPFIDLWRQKFPEPDRFPTWKEFDLSDLEGWWGKVSLMEILHDPFDIRWVLWGSAITQWWGKDYTNKRISEIPEIQDVWNKFERPYLENLTDNGLIGFVSGTLSPQEREFLHIAGVDLPLVKDGKITHVMSAYLLRDADDDFSPGPEPVFVVE